MKFKAILTDHGVNLLEKRFVPSLDKIGRICHLYLTRDHAIFLHNLLNGGGIQSIAQFRKETLFDDYRISSQNDDRIAFAIDLGLLHRALRSSLTIEGGDRLQIKLVKKLPPGSHQPMPFLTFETKVFAQMTVCSEYFAVLFSVPCWAKAGRYYNSESRPKRMHRRLSVGLCAISNSMAESFNLYENG